MFFSFLFAPIIGIAPQCLRANICCAGSPPLIGNRIPLANSAKICPIKPNRFSTEPSSNDRLAEALRTRNPQWTTRALWYPPAQSRRHLPNAHEAAPGRYRNQAVKIHSPEDSVVPLSSMRCSHPAARPTDAAPALHIHNLNRHEGRQGKIKHQRSGLPKGIGIVAAHCERCRQCLRANVQLQ